MTQVFECTIVVVDVVGFTAPERHLSDRLAVHQGMYEVLKTAFVECDIDFDSCAKEDRGDGVLILLPSGTTRSTVADRLPERIVVALRRYNWTRTRRAQIRLRVSLNSGDVVYDGHGWVGEAVDTAFRILDAEVAKAAFARSDRLIALISSERFFADVIAQDPGLLPETYNVIPVKVKSFTGSAYLRLQGASSSPDPIPPEPSRNDDGGPATLEAGHPVHDLIAGRDLTLLRHRLTRLPVPRLAVLMSRALGPAIPLPPLDDVTDAWSALELLTDFNAGPDGIPPAVTFLRLLAEEVGGESGDAIKAWIGEQARQLRLGPALEVQRRALPPLPVRPQLHLMIMLEPVADHPGRCTLAFWRQDDPEVWPPALGGVREIAIDEAEYRVDEVIVAAERVWSGQSVSASVEFLLPRTLINLPVRRWRKEHASGDPQPLRYGYRLGIRSLERMRAEHWHRNWLLRWDSMLEDPSADRLHYSGRAESARQPVDAVLSDERWVGLVMACPPPPRPDRGAGPDDLTSALRGGLPVILWHPDAGPEDLRELLGWMLSEDGGLRELLERHKLANSRADRPFANSLIDDLVVMYDDPKRLIVLDRPLIPTRQ
ncbi:hypothetical protein AB0J55_22485 [Amycolatopsis sp. NPDC049688]|uniref:VMAP-C domain-containing protein n=1 Tax=Amycolatopsis sp. NPDC049688 TaxID=3154733 RepID=UPI0034268CF9